MSRPVTEDRFRKIQAVVDKIIIGDGIELKYEENLKISFMFFTKISKTAAPVYDFTASMTMKELYEMLFDRQISIIKEKFAEFKKRSINNVKNTDSS
jgi:hypothetical protein